MPYQFAEPEAVLQLALTFTLGARVGRMGSWLSFPLCGEPETHVPAPMNGLVATVLLQLPFIKHMCAPFHRICPVCCSEAEFGLKCKWHADPLLDLLCEEHTVITLDKQQHGRRCCAKGYQHTYLWDTQAELPPAVPAGLVGWDVMLQVSAQHFHTTWD